MIWIVFPGLYDSQLLQFPTLAFIMRLMESTEQILHPKCDCEANGTASFVATALASNFLSVLFSMFSICNVLLCSVLSIACVCLFLSCTAQHSGFLSLIKKGGTGAAGRANLPVLLSFFSRGAPVSSRGLHAGKKSPGFFQSIGLQIRIFRRFGCPRTFARTVSLIFGQEWCRFLHLFLDLLYRCDLGGFWIMKIRTHRTRKVDHGRRFPFVCLHQGPQAPTRSPGSGTLSWEGRAKSGALGQ